MKKFINNIKFMFKYSRNNKWRLILYLFLNILNLVIGIILPIVSANMVVNLTNNELNQLFFAGLILYVLSLLIEIVNYFMNIQYAIITNKIFQNFNEGMLDTYISIESKNIDKAGTGEITNRITNEPQQMIDMLAKIDTTIISLVKSLGIFIIIFIISPVILLFLLFQLLLTTYINSVGNKNINSIDKKSRIMSDDKDTLYTEIIRGIKDVKMLNTFNSLKDKIKTKNEQVINSKINLTKKRYNYSFITLFAGYTYNFLLIVLFIFMINNNLLTSVNALIIFNYSISVVFFGSNLSDLISYIQKFNLSADRVKELFDDNLYEKETFGNTTITNIKGNIEFKNVDFTYNDNQVLKKLNLKITKNKTVALVGKSGSGKTTIFNLLCKLYNVDDNSIFIDGIDINKLDKDSIRGNITLINQNPYIFNMTIRENLILVKNDLTDEKMIEACKNAAIHDYITTLPEQYDTKLGEGGINLSGGQRQRLAIARALIQKTKIILFDEATSALDNETQSKIQKAINNIHSKYTIIIIAHRLSTIIDSDEILFVDDGKIIAKGTHKELLKNSIEYKQLYQSEIEK